MVSRLLLLTLPFVAACPIVKECTLIGCVSELILDVTADGAPVRILSGSVTVGGTTYAVQCDGTDATGSDAAVQCPEVGQILIMLPDGAGGGEVEYALTGLDGADTGYNPGFDGSGSFTPDWSSSQPNGPDCGPTCWNATAGIALDVLD